MTLKEMVMKSWFAVTKWQVLKLHSLIPLKFSELYIGNSYDVLHNLKKSDLDRLVVSYFRKDDHSKYILILEDIK